MDPFTMLLMFGGGATALAVFGAPKNGKAKTGAQAPAPPPAPGRAYQLDANLPQHILNQVAGALQMSNDPVQLEGLAVDIEKDFPKCAAALREKERRLLAGPPPPWFASSAGSPPATVASGTAPVTTIGPPAQTAPAQVVPVAPPAPPMVTVPTAPQGTSYDAGGGGGAYWGNGPDPTAPSGVLASYPAPTAPLPAPAPASVLTSYPAPTASLATPAPVAAPARAPSPAPSASAAQRNAGRPQEYPYITLRGESTYPSKIAFQATGVEMDYPQLSAINPQFVHNGQWMNIQIGDEINIPPAWKARLSSVYHVTDAPAGTLLAPAPVAPPPVELLPSVAAAVTAPPAVSVSAPAAASRAAAPLPVPIQMLPNPEPPHAPAEALSIAYHPSTAPSTSGNAPVHASESPPASAATSGTYTVKKGDFPVKIAKAITGDSKRWPELVAANPTKPKAPDGNFATLKPGEVLHLPTTWSTAPLMGGNHAQVA